MEYYYLFHVEFMDELKVKDDIRNNNELFLF